MGEMETCTQKCRVHGCLYNLLKSLLEREIDKCLIEGDDGVS